MKFSIFVERFGLNEISVRVNTLGKMKETIISLTNDDLPVDEIIYHIGKSVKNFITEEKMKP